MSCGSGTVQRPVSTRCGVSRAPVRLVPRSRNFRLQPPSAADASPDTGTGMMEQDLTYRENVGVCIVNSQGLVFAGQRCDDVLNTWQMPQGGIDDGEEPHAAALREVAEETNITSATIVGEMDRWLTYDFPTKVRQKLHGGWQRFKGQKQKWFLAYFSGEDSEVNLDTEHKEFKAWRWMNLEDLPGSVVEFKREVYAEVAKDFVPRIADLTRSRQANGDGTPAK